MKKLMTAAALAVLCVSNTYAEVKAVTDASKSKGDPVSFTMERAVVYGVLNVSSDRALTTRFFVKPMVYVNHNQVPADKVFLNCNDVKTYITPGEWAVCNIEPTKSATVTILPQDYQNGADASYEIGDYVKK